MLEVIKGIECSVSWYQDGKLHREGGEPARILKDEETGVNLEMEWSENGIEHRIGGPSYVCRDPNTGVLTGESWKVHGLYHRENGPAVIERDGEDGRVMLTEYHHFGRKLEREP